MLTQRAPVLARFTRNDASRAAVAATVLIMVMTAILAVDLLPSAPIDYQVGQVVREDIAAPRAISFESTTLTQQARDEVRSAVPLQFDFTADKAIAARPPSEDVTGATDTGRTVVVDMNTPSGSCGEPLADLQNARNGRPLGASPGSRDRARDAG